MGYDIISSRTKKEWFEKGNLHHIQCQYAYQGIFQEALGYDIKELEGRLLKKDILKYVSELSKIIAILKKDSVNIPMHRGNLANCSKERLIDEFEELRGLIDNGKVGYISIS